MLKFVYKVIILIAVFIGALVFMGGTIKEETVGFDTTVKMKEATFPVIYLETEDNRINLLRGYGGNMDANIIRESITPINKSKVFTVQIQENESVVKKVKYEIRESSNNKLLDSGSVSALDSTEKGKSTEIKIQAVLETSKEYLVKMTLVTDVSKKIHYYTRIKYYEDDSFLQEKLDFITYFHESSMDKKKAEELIRYLEPNYSEENNSFSKVSIHSSFDLVSWGNLKPKVITEVTPRIKEFNIETASIILDYFVSAKTESGTEIYKVREFYRVRYTQSRIYLLKFDRTMEALFDPELTSLTKSEFKIGITGETELEMNYSGDNNKMCFVREGALWYYNLLENQAVQVYSFLDEEKDYIRNGYDQHDIQVLSMDDNGDINFMVYGYMNRGDYEGRVAMVLYRFYASENRIEELVYIPLESTYQILKENLNEFSYVNTKEVFYFTIDNVIYSYNMIAKKLSVVAENVSDQNLMTLEETKSIAWTDSENPQKIKNITILNLETEKQEIIKAPKGNNIRLLGSIDSNLIYGYVKTEDIKESTDGTLIIPAYKIEIANSSGEVLKIYQKKNIYIRDIDVKNNVIHLSRVKKGQNNMYEPVEEDSILNKDRDNKNPISLTTRVTNLTLTELYISFPNGFAMKDKPKIEVTKNTVITEDTTLRLQQIKQRKSKYYVDAGGSVVASYNSPAEAIISADELMGVVLNQQYQLVWERGNRYNNKNLAGITMISTGGGVDSIGACLSMVLKYNQISVGGKEISESNQSIYSVLKEYLKNPINLTGCTVDEILYFISGGVPVIAMKDANNAVLITAYDSYYVTIMDPTTRSSKKMTIVAAESMFEAAGNIFISYINK